MLNRKNFKKLPINVILTSDGKFYFEGISLLRGLHRQMAGYCLRISSVFVLFVGIVSLLGLGSRSSQFLEQNHLNLLSVETAHSLPMIEPLAITADLDETSDVSMDVEAENVPGSYLSAEKNKQRYSGSFNFSIHQSIFALLYDLPPPYAVLQS
ncbi:hypothetical protein ACUNWD_15015 [Sunxiuqinia sp. A32]|uniref:hypothetical protein n=1 Tax=Sunxiuqinia sp. A32 TaxID=3461496 RepID=UPI0040463DF5